MSDITCTLCKKEIEIQDDGSAHFARIQRGWFDFTFDIAGKDIDDVAEANIKCEIWLCIDCYLSDPDLCAFFNKIGFQVR